MFFPMNRLLCLSLCLSALNFSLLRAAEEPVDFAREVLPVLSNKCYVCHGPDPRKKNELRLDSYAAATADRKGVRAIDPDDLEESEILYRIHDKEDPMPPLDAEKRAANPRIRAHLACSGGHLGRPNVIATVDTIEQKTWSSIVLRDESEVDLRT